MKSLYINKLVNVITESGKKQKSEGRVIKSFKNLQKHSIKQPYELLQTAVKSLIPIYRLQLLTNKKRRKKNRQIKKKACLVLSPTYRLTLAIKYIVNAIRQQKKTKIDEILAEEILLTCQTSSNSLKKKLEDHEQINRYYVRRFYRWKKG
jgi:small subunit ribosomal protein S7